MLGIRNYIPGRIFLQTRAGHELTVAGLYMLDMNHDPRTLRQEESWLLMMMQLASL